MLLSLVRWQPAARPRRSEISAPRALPWGRWRRSGAADGGVSGTEGRLSARSGRSLKYSGPIFVYMNNRWSKVIATTANNRLNCMALVALIGMVGANAPLVAEGVRSSTKNSAQDWLQGYQPLIQKAESGGKLCDLGILGTWHKISVTRVSYRGLQNGLAPGDTIVELNGEEVTSENFASRMSRLDAGDKFSLRVSRGGRFTDLVGECGDGTGLSQAGFDIVRAASAGKWNACIKSTNAVDKLNDLQTAFTASWRLQCFVAKMCSDKRCKRMSSASGRYLYDYHRLAIEEMAAIGELDHWRWHYLNAMTVLKDHGFRKRARELEAVWNEADAARQKTKEVQ